jgi:hypothetical protein
LREASLGARYRRPWSWLSRHVFHIRLRVTSEPPIASSLKLRPARGMLYMMFSAT